MSAPTGRGIKNPTAILVLLTGLNFLNYIDRMVLAAVLDDVPHLLVGMVVLVQRHRVGCDVP